MSLVKSSSNMYDFVTHMHSHLRGECPHKCEYCYVKSTTAYRTGHYQGALSLSESAFKVNYGSGKTIFIDHMNDLFADRVPRMFIRRVLAHCNTWPDNTYVLQSKNPATMLDFWMDFPERTLCGTTLETNREELIRTYSHATRIDSRVYNMRRLAERGTKTFVTIEPVMDFDVEPFANMISICNPFFVNLGADSKGHNLPEPTVDKIMALVAALKERGIELREKHNLERLVSK